MKTLSRLAVYPVKSMKGLQLTYAQVTLSGLSSDRAFMVAEPDGTFITARQFPQLVCFTPVLTPEGLLLVAPDGSSTRVRYADFQPEPRDSEVWGNHFPSRVAPTAVNQWLSGFFPRPVELRWTGFDSARRVKKVPEVPLSFADGYPYLLVNEASLRDLQQRCPAGVQMSQFRPNLIISGAQPWEEDSWAVIRIGELIFDVAKPCSRCVLTTVSPTRGRKHPTAEPMTTLQRFRQALDGSGDIDFGMNLIARSSGVIHAGDRLEVLKTRPPRPYGGSEPVETLAVDAVREATVRITFQGKTFHGNNQQILLDQLEMQGLRIPYSCRAGICGSCRLQLLAGEVTPLKQGAVEGESLLSCSCIPAGDVTLA
ncbi:YcbX family protein [Pantoea sp. 1.19]|uniref:YcbX family protein n=1 Tax=Pantoea sp. 1.19 TaxID=1925589 RepID=UPI00094914CD|nr:YcbX family protein [Pantoea sp. 1.19]